MYRAIAVAVYLSLQALTVPLLAETHHEIDGLVVVEAEHYSAKYADTTGTREWYIQDGSSSGPGPDPDSFHTGAVGNAYVECKPDTRVTSTDPMEAGSFYNSTTQGARLDYPIYFETPGVYYVWVRVQSTGTEDNGMHVAVNGSVPSQGWRIQWCGGGWRWSNAQRDSGGSSCGINGTIYVNIPSAGQHLISFYQREDGAEMDRFLMTNSSSYEPTNQGPDESEIFINGPSLEVDTTSIELTVTQGSVVPHNPVPSTLMSCRVPNGSFEDPALKREPVFGNDKSHTTASDYDPIPEWTLDFKPSPADGHAMGVLDLTGQLLGYDPEHGAADGDNAAYINSVDGGGAASDTISLDLPVYAIPGDSYTLRVGVSGRLDFTDPMYLIDLYIGDTIVASDRNTLSPLPRDPRVWSDSILTYTATPADLDQPLRVRLGIPTGGGMQILFDDVRLVKPFNPSDLLRFSVRNTEIDTLNYQITENLNWLSLSATSGSSVGEYDRIDITLDTAALAVGTYDGSITVSDPGVHNSPQVISVVLHVVPVSGDFDGDQDVDQEDFGHFQACYSGQGVAQLNSECLDARLDSDDDVDQEDFGIFQACFSGAEVAADPLCHDRS